MSSGRLRVPDSPPLCGSFLSFPRFSCSEWTPAGQGGGRVIRKKGSAMWKRRGGRGRRRGEESGTALRSQAARGEAWERRPGEEQEAAAGRGGRAGGCGRARRPRAVGEGSAAGGGRGRGAQMLRCVSKVKTENKNCLYTNSARGQLAASSEPSAAPKQPGEGARLPSKDPGAGVRLCLPGPAPGPPLQRRQRHAVSRCRVGCRQRFPLIRLFPKSKCGAERHLFQN